MFSTLHESSTMLKAVSRKFSFWAGVALAAFAVLVWAVPAVNFTTIPSAVWMYFAYVALVCTACSFPVGRWVLPIGALVLLALCTSGIVGGFVLSHFCVYAFVVTALGAACSFLPRFQASALTVTWLCCMMAIYASEWPSSTPQSTNRQWPAMDPSQMPVLAKGNLAPAIEADDLRGERMTLSEYRGKVVMLAFWTSWCGPCMAEVPHEKSLLERFAGRPFAIVGVNSDDTTQYALAAVEKHSIPRRSFWNGGAGGPITDQWGIRKYPTVYLIDDAGVIQHQDLHGAALDATLEEMIAKAESQTRQPRE